MDRLESLDAFVRVVEEGGFAPAARALRRSPSMIAKHIAALERSVGSRLFHRTTRSVTLTDAGEHFYHHAQTILAEFACALTEARSKQAQPSGSLRISLPTAFVELIGKELSAFSAEYPQLSLDIVCSDEVLDLARNRIDVAIRAGILPDSSLRARKLWSYRMVVCASPAYLAERGTPETLADLAAHDCIAYSLQWAGDSWTFAKPDGSGPLVIALSRVSHRVNSPAMQRQLALLGHGLIRLPRALAAAELSSGALVPVLTQVPDVERWVHAVYLQGGTAPRAVRLMIDHLRQRERPDW